ncbi:MAG: hypothetical protein EOO12_07155 [Chitinophagaceae bacterium]|nr:MAG: hypothetical protein EOO12_07155 [Chitinophagaceae bacterium]
MNEIEEYERKRRQQISTGRSIMNYVMGVLFALVGLFFGYVYLNRIELMGSKASTKDLVVCLIFLGYGIWRIYRGYKKNYFRE